MQRPPHCPTSPRWPTHGPSPEAICVYIGAGENGEGNASEYTALTSQLFRGGNPVADNLIATLAMNATGLNKTNDFDVNTFYIKVLTEVSNLLVSAPAFFPLTVLKVLKGHSCTE